MNDDRPVSKTRRRLNPREGSPLDFNKSYSEPPASPPTVAVACQLSDGPKFRPTKTMSPSTIPYKKATIRHRILL